MVAKFKKFVDIIVRTLLFTYPLLQDRIIKHTHCHKNCDMTYCRNDSKIDLPDSRVVTAVSH